MYGLYAPVKMVIPLGAWTYDQIGDPSVSPIDINDLKSHLRIDYTNESEETYLKMLIFGVTHYAENYMNLCLITRNWVNYRDYFESIIEIRRPPFGTLTSFKYLNSLGVLTTVDSAIYYLTSGIYPIIALKSNYVWPVDISNTYQAVEIKFSSGYGANKTDVPEDIRMALLCHAAFLYSNRGDSDISGASSGDTSMSAIPNFAKLIYDAHRVKTLTQNTYYTNYPQSI